jgi:hypothetical protein
VVLFVNPLVTLLPNLTEMQEFTETRSDIDQLKIEQKTKIVKT